MFSIPFTFTNEDENYITIPALKRFAREKKQDDLKTNLDRPELIQDVVRYANKSEENEETVKNWLDNVLVEGIKEVQVKYIDEMNSNHMLRNMEYLNGILEPLIANDKNRHLCGKYTPELQLFKYEIVEDAVYGLCIKLYMGKLLCIYDKKREQGQLHIQFLLRYI